MSKIDKMLQARQLLEDCGGYDTSIAGAIGEVYAEEVFSMVKAPRGEKGYDGFINERKVQVKGKERLKKPESSSYVAIRNSLKGMADDLLVVYWDLDDKSLKHIGPVEISRITGSQRQNEIRYYIHNIRKAFSENSPDNN